MFLVTHYLLVTEFIGHRSQSSCLQLGGGSQKGTSFLFQGKWGSADKTINANQAQLTPPKY